MFKKILNYPMLRHGITLIAAGLMCYLAYREYNKMMERLEIIANELYKSKQEIIALKKNRNSNFIRNVKLSRKSKPSKTVKKKMQKYKPMPKINPIDVTKKQSSINRISQHLPTKVQALESIIETAHEQYEHAQIINMNNIDDMDINKEIITYDSDSDLLSDNETDILDSEEDDILSENSEIIDTIGTELQQELNAEIGDLDLEAELNTDILIENTNSISEENMDDDKQILQEEIEKLAEVVEQEIIAETQPETQPETQLETQLETQNKKQEPILVEIDTQIKNKNAKIFGIDTITIKDEKKNPKQTPKKRKGRKGLVTSWTAFMKNDEIEKQILVKYPDADFGQVSKIKGQIWRTYTPDQKDVYKQIAKELTKLNRQQQS